MNPLDSVLGSPVAVFILGGAQMLLVVWLVTRFLKGVEQRMEQAAKQGVGEYKGRKRIDFTDPTSRVLLVISGDDDKLALDLTAFRKVRERSGLPFTRLMPATIDALDKRLSKIRMTYGNSVKYVHISAHANPDFIQLDRPVDPVLLSSMLSGVEVLFLCGCETTDFGDELGVVPNVVSLMEPIDHEDAVRFAEVFWMAIGEGEDPANAFDRACRLLPAISEFAYMHI